MQQAQAKSGAGEGSAPGGKAKKAKQPPAAAASAAPAPAVAASEPSPSQHHLQLEAHKKGHHATAGAEVVVHWRKKGWDWDADGRPCGALDVRETWGETIYHKPEGWKETR